MRNTRFLWLVALLALTLVAQLQPLAARTPAAKLPPGFQMKAVANGLDLPTDMVFLPNGDLLVTEKGRGAGADGIGHVRLVQNGVVLSTPVLTLGTNVTQDSGIGAIIVDPSFEQNGYFYVYYPTGEFSNGWNGQSEMRLSRFTFDFETQTADPAGEQIVLLIDSWSKYHHGGAMAFDDAGNLYLAIGDLARSPAELAPFDLGRFEGKLLRIRPTESGYDIPSDNPYVGDPDALPEIYASGLRNPFRMARHSDGTMVLTDVGSTSWEEINLVTPAANYGWPQREGPCPRGQIQPCRPVQSIYSDPLVYYQHPGAEIGAAVTGVAFYEGDDFPSQYRDKLFFADITDYIAIAEMQTPQIDLFVTEHATVVDLAYFNNQLFVLSLNLGRVSSIFYTEGANIAPSVDLATSVSSGAPPLSVDFTATAYDPDDVQLTYYWDFGDGSELMSFASSVTHLYAEEGNYDATLFVRDLRGAESVVATASITVYAGEFPQISLDNLSGERERYHGGDEIRYSVSRSTFADLDRERPFSWRIDLHHNQHSHPLISSNNVVSDVLQIPTENHDSEHALWYDFSVTMYTAAGIEVKQSRALLPLKKRFTIAASIPYVDAELNFIEVRTPYSLLSIVGIENQAEVPQEALTADGIYRFDSWQWSGGSSNARTLHFTTAAEPITYSAVYIYDRPAQRQLLPLITR